MTFLGQLDKSGVEVERGKAVKGTDAGFRVQLDMEAQHGRAEKRSWKRQASMAHGQWRRPCAG